MSQREGRSAVPGAVAGARGPPEPVLEAGPASLISGPGSSKTPCGPRAGRRPPGGAPARPALPPAVPAPPAPRGDRIRGEAAAGKERGASCAPGADAAAGAGLQGTQAGGQASRRRLVGLPARSCWAAAAGGDPRMQKKPPPPRIPAPHSRPDCVLPSKTRTRGGWERRGCGPERAGRGLEGARTPGAKQKGPAQAPALPPLPPPGSGSPSLGGLSPPTRRPEPTRGAREAAAAGAAREEGRV